MSTSTINNDFWKDLQDSISLEQNTNDNMDQHHPTSFLDTIFPKADQTRHGNLSKEISKISQIVRSIQDQDYPLPRRKIQHTSSPLPWDSPKRSNKSTNSSKLVLATRSSPTHSLRPKKIHCQHITPIQQTSAITSTSIPSLCDPDKISQMSCTR